MTASSRAECVGSIGSDARQLHPELAENGTQGSTPRGRPPLTPKRRSQLPSGNGQPLLHPKENLGGLGTGNLGELFDQLVAAGSRFYLSGGSSAARGLSEADVVMSRFEMAGRRPNNID